VSGSNVLATRGWYNAHFDADEPFTFVSGWFTAGWHARQTMFVTGYRFGVPLSQVQFDITDTAPTRYEFGWAGVTRVATYSPTGDEGFYAIDDLIVVTTPEPTILGLVAIGLLALVGVVKRRRLRAVKGNSRSARDALA
jgi:hypothetical protein